MILREAFKKISTKLIFRQAFYFIYPKTANNEVKVVFLFPYDLYTLKDPDLDIKSSEYVFVRGALGFKQTKYQVKMFTK